MTVNATMALRNRLDEMESATQTRIEKLSTRVAHLESLLSSGDASPEKRPRVDDTPASVYVEQIKALTQDVLKEKRDKERMVSTLETLQTSVRNMEDQYQKLSRQRNAMLNARRYSAFPPLPAYHVNDDGGVVLHDSDDDEEEEEEEGVGDQLDYEIAMMKRSVGYGKHWQFSGQFFNV